MDAAAIPLHEIERALSIMQYASTERVMFEMLVFTGCRISELDNMKISQIQDGYVYWKLGKNQTSYRKIMLPEAYILELKEFRSTHRCYADKLFQVHSRTFVEYFNKRVRPLLGRNWLERQNNPMSVNINCQYVLQLKGLRKTYSTLRFWREYQEWHDPAIAMEMTSKDMKHSTTHITAYHYIRNFSSLGIRPGSVVCDIKKIGGVLQCKVTDY